MKIARYLAHHNAGIGVVTDRGLIEVTREVSELSDIGDALTARGQAMLRASVPTARHVLMEGDFEYLPPLAARARIFCVGLNYRDHVEETGRAFPPNPAVFIRTQESVTGHMGHLINPLESREFDFEGELAVVIGKSGRRVPEHQALAHVGGYTCFNDGSARDWQRHSVTAGKNFDSSGALGPWISTADEIPDPATLRLATRINGIEKQHAALSELIYTIPRVISYVSTFTLLLPGDVITTGTPAGVGSRRKPPVWLQNGDVLEIEVSAVGTLRACVSTASSGTSE